MTQNDTNVLKAAQLFDQPRKLYSQEVMLQAKQQRNQCFASNCRSHLFKSFTLTFFYQGYPGISRDAHGMFQVHWSTESGRGLAPAVLSSPAVESSIRIKFLKGGAGRSMAELRAPNVKCVDIVLIYVDMI